MVTAGRAASDAHACGSCRACEHNGHCHTGGGFDTRDKCEGRIDHNWCGVSKCAANTCNGGVCTECTANVNNCGNCTACGYQGLCLSGGNYSDEEQCGSRKDHYWCGTPAVDCLDGFHCECRPGFSGARCQTNIDECDSNPCKNGGSCVDGVNMYTCQCRPGYTGATCDDAAPTPTARAPLTTTANSTKHPAANVQKESSQTITFRSTTQILFAQPSIGQGGVTAKPTAQGTPQNTDAEAEATEAFDYTLIAVGAVSITALVVICALIVATRRRKRNNLRRAMATMEADTTSWLTSGSRRASKMTRALASPSTTSQPGGAAKQPRRSALTSVSEETPEFGAMWNNPLTPGSRKEHSEIQEGVEINGCHHGGEADELLREEPSLTANADACSSVFGDNSSEWSGTCADTIDGEAAELWYDGDTIVSSHRAILLKDKSPRRHGKRHQSGSSEINRAYETRFGVGVQRRLASMTLEDRPFLSLEVVSQDCCTAAPATLLDTACQGHSTSPTACSQMATWTEREDLAPDIIKEAGQ